MNAYVTPGIYKITVVQPPVDIRLVRTDIAGFVGFAERGPGLVQPFDQSTASQSVVKLTSWEAFRSIFGGFIPNGYLAYAVRGFFACGGNNCYVVRVGSAKSPPTTAKLPLPAAEKSQLITFLAAAMNFGQAQIKLESTAVVAIDDLIAIGDPLTGECLSVASIIDDQTITVRPLPTTQYPVDTPVYAILGTLLSQSATAGDTDLQVAKVDNFIGNDLVSIEGGGLSEIRVVSMLSGNSAIRLARALDFSYPAGSIVRKYPAAFNVRAMSPGAWGNRIKLAIAPLEPQSAVQQFSLRVTVDASSDLAQPIEQEFYPQLSLDPSTRGAATPIYAPDVVNAISQIISMDQTIPPETFLLTGSGPLASGVQSLQGGFDGVEVDTVSTQDFVDALNALALIDEIGILCCPDAVLVPPPSYAPPAPPTPDPCSLQSAMLAPNPAAKNLNRATKQPAWSIKEIQTAMIVQCSQLRYRVALLDPPNSLQPNAVLKWLNDQAFDSTSAKFAAINYPWLKVPDALAPEGPNRIVPPCGHIAGAYAYTDNQFGVQKPPANVQLDFVADLVQIVSDDQQGFLNDVGINAIRAFPGRGIRLWGARSISQEPNWRYIHTRRLLSMIEDSVEKASQWTVFQSNDADLRRMLTHSLNIFLESIWRTGGLKGTVPTDSYYVKCDDTNNPQSSIDAGQLICQIGVAIAAPMEFLVFELRRSVAGSQVVEA